MPEKTLTIVFRGLMVFRQQGSGAGSRFEIGLVPVTHHMPPHHVEHIPRISTFKNGVLDSVKVLKGVHPTHRIWRLEVDGATTAGVTKDQQGATLDRTTHTYDRDYRWLIDLEHNTEFYGPLLGKIDTSVLKPVIHIPSGVFYTRLKSHKQNRKMDGEAEKPFGYAAAAMACDIKLTGPGARLKVADTGAEIFPFEPEADTLYEIANTPPDTHVPVAGEEHFLHYYDMFTTSVPKFHFKEPGPPGPSPALCGESELSQFPNPL